ncbi:MAG: hypothetical protein QW582_01625 [Candidatus Micrarchaeaceae archaeon]
MVNEAREKIAIDLAKQIKDGKVLVSSIDEILLEKGVRAQSERLKIKNLINGVLTHEAILELNKKETAKNVV